MIVRTRAWLEVRHSIRRDWLLAVMLLLFRGYLPDSHPAIKGAVWMLAAVLLLNGNRAIRAER